MVVARGEAAAVLALGVGAALLAAPALSPPALWFDDAWVGLAARASTAGETALAGLTSPGFALLVALVTLPFGTSPLAAQLLPFAAGVLLPPTGWAAARAVGLGRGAALLVGALLLASPVLTTYATRVKPYTLEALLVTLLLVAGWRLVDRPDLDSRWFAASGLAVASIIVSSVTALAAAAALGAGLVQLAFERLARERGPVAGDGSEGSGSGRKGARAPLPLRGLAAAGATVLFAGGWYLLFLRPRITPALREFWAPHYLVRDEGLPAMARSLAELGGGFAASFSLFPAPLVMAALVLAAGAVLGRGARSPGLVVLLVGPFAGALALAAAGAAPLGGGRTDAWLLPVAALLLGAGAGALVERLEWGARVRVGATAVVLLLVLVGVRPAEPYPEHDVRSLVERLERERAVGEVVLVQRHTRFGYGLHTTAPVRLVPDPESWQGFEVEVEDPGVWMLPFPEARLRWDILRVTSETDGAVWVIESHDEFNPGMRGAIENALLEAGLGLRDVHEVTGARLTRWER